MTVSPKANAKNTGLSAAPFSSRFGQTDRFATHFTKRECFVRVLVRGAVAAAGFLRMVEIFLTLMTSAQKNCHRIYNRKRAPKNRIGPGTKFREQRRGKAIELLKDGMSKAQVANRLGVSRTAVGKWWAVYERHGIKAIAAKPHLGPPRKLSRMQLRQLPKLLEEAAEPFGFSGELWTTARVVKLIELSERPSATKSGSPRAEN